MSRRRYSRRITPRFSGGAPTYVPWHFVHHRPLQPVVRRLALRLFVPRERHVQFSRLCKKNAAIRFASSSNCLELVKRLLCPLPT